jgi:hypothetical protein
MNEREIKLKIIEYAEEIAKVLSEGADCEIRITRDGVTVARVKKKVVVR